MSMGCLMNRNIIVIGGGPAGMMAACAAAEQGGNVCLLEPNERLGKKLNITGKGRCNVTNDCESEEFLRNMPAEKRHRAEWERAQVRDFLAAMKESDWEGVKLALTAMGDSRELSDH